MPVAQDTYSIRVSCGVTPKCPVDIIYEHYEISAFVFVQPSFVKIHQASLIDAERIAYVNTVNMCFTLVK